MERAIHARDSSARAVLWMERGDRYEWDGKVDRFSRPRNLAFWFEEGPKPVSLERQNMINLVKALAFKISKP
ncbi:MAG: hypothetical protein EAZ10_05475 [Oscillatoriales cyanobacterium]|nr:MAG: hypothetical protein EAZ10_05475 [Oscillatoriales cyanobacterium]